MSCFLSITVPTYNRADCLRKALKGILTQVGDIPSAEVVICDNASTDHTAEVCGEFVKTYPSVRYFRNDSNLGFDGNIRACVTRSTGEYVSFFSDDDIPEPGYFNALSELLQAHEPTIVYVNHASFYCDNPESLGKPKGPGEFVVTQDGVAFFSRYGLGFISALTLRRSTALYYCDKVVMGRGSAHVDMAGRMALVGKGPFIYNGNLSVWARYDDTYNSHFLRYGFVNLARLYQELLEEGLLPERDYQYSMKRMVLHGLSRSIIGDRCHGEAMVPVKELSEVYGGVLWYYVLAFPLAIMPPTLVRGIALPMRQLIRYWRHRRHGS
jgi:glycosyltransferase involved in cell wall biosynthesis